MTTSFARILKAIGLALGACLAMHHIEGAEGPMTITIASPVDGASFQIGTNIQFSVNLENASSNGVHVTYYEGAKVRARATAPPFDATWHAPGLGLHAITAVVTDKAGDQATSQSIMISVGPRNDQFDHAIPVKGKAPTFSGTTLGASLEPGEPNWNGGGSVWYSWTPTSSGRLGMSISKGGDEPLIGLYTGDSVSNLTTVGSSWLPYGWINAFDCAVQAGTNYKILVSGTASDPTHFVVKSAFVPLPSNDDFENRAVLPPYGGKMTSQNFSATWQPGEPDDLVPYTAGYGSSHRTIWWTWTAPVKGRISFNIDCNFGASTMGIYSGDALSNLVAVGYGYTGVGPYDVPAGTTYQISVDGFGGQVGTVKLTATFNPAPSNDDFAHSQIITGAVAVLKGTTIGATSEPGETPRYSIWYSWTAPASAYVTINPLGGPTGAAVSVYTGSSVTNLSVVAEGGGGTVSFDATAGTTYQIAISGFEGWQSTFDLQLVMSTVRLIRPSPEQSFPVGSKILLAATSTSLDGGSSELDFTLNSTFLGKVSRTKPAAYLVNAPLGSYTLVATVPDSGGVIHRSRPVNFYVRPVNDSFADRAILPASGGAMDGTTEAATFEPGEPRPADPTAWSDDASVWYSWTAPAVGVASVGTTAGNLGVFTGDAVTNLTFFPPLDRGGYRFRASAGTTYAIRVSGAYNVIPSDIGSFHFSLSENIAPLNDNFANRTVLTGSNPGTNGSLLGCSTESGEPNEAPNGASAWYSWTAPFSGLLFVTNSAYALGIFKGDSLSTLTNVGHGPFRVQAGDTYQIQVSTLYGSEGNAQMSFGLGLTLWPPPPNDNFSQAAPLSGTSLSTNGYYAGGTIQTGESAPQAATASLWYTWTAPASGRVVIIGTQSALSLTAYTGNSVSNLAFIADSTVQWNGNYYFELDFNAVAGTNYQIALFAPDDGTSLGSFQLSLNMPDVPASLISGGLVMQMLTPPNRFLPRQWPPHTLANPTLLSSGHFQFELHGLSGATYTVLSATNLSQPEASWEPVITTTLSGSAAIFRDDAATNSHRFYRVRRER